MLSTWLASAISCEHSHIFLAHNIIIWNVSYWVEFLQIFRNKIIIMSQVSKQTIARVSSYSYYTSAGCLISLVFILKRVTYIQHLDGVCLPYFPVFGMLHGPVVKLTCFRHFLFFHILVNSRVHNKNDVLVSKKWRTSKTSPRRWLLIFFFLIFVTE